MYIGIDPGKSGCMAILTKKKEITFLDWPKDNDLKYLYELIDFHAGKDAYGENRVTMAILERVHSMPKQGVSSMFTFGTNFGIWQGFLTALEWPYQLVPPQTWMKGVVAKADGPDAKSRIKNVAQRLYPKAELTGPQGGFKDGRADALMMAHYAMITYK